MADAYAELSHHPADPDAQQTLTDFIDYTEFFPSDLFRSLTLIGKLDESFKDDSAKVHNFTKIYGSLPDLPLEDRPHPKNLRRDISLTLDHALRSREASRAEATRLCNVADALYEKLVGIKEKLVAMPTPPSRDLTPVPLPKSPVQSRHRKHHDKSTNTKLGAQKDGSSISPSVPKPQKNRQRRIVVPGEPLPPYDPLSPGADISTDSEADREFSPIDTIRVEPFGEVRRKKMKMSRSARPARIYSMSGPLPKVRPRGVFGTNVHSQVAGISVSNAMASLTPPPENPPPGSEWAPWLELTDWELNILRRRMKKNANWTPSDTMKRRTLAEKGRGQAAFLKAKEDAEKAGVVCLNEKPHKPGRRAEAATPTGEYLLPEQPENVTNRGMKLNEQKKLKQVRDLIASSDQVPDASELQRIIADAGRNVQEALTMHEIIPTIPIVETAPTSKKRKSDTLDEPFEPRTDMHEGAAVKHQRLRLIGPGEGKEVTVTSHVPLAPEGPSSPKKRGRPRRMSVSRVSTPTPQTAELTASPKAAMQPPSSMVSKRPSSSRGTSIILTVNQKAASAEPPSRKIFLRRSSNVSLPAGSPEPAPKLPGRKGRKPAPGFLKTEGDVATTVSSAKRKAKPGRPIEKNIPVDEVDPDEPRYCICDDVSYGDMVACENQDKGCEGGEWFHFGCVGLSEQPPRRQKWYCPVCREKMGVDSSGIAPPPKANGRRSQTAV